MLDLIVFADAGGTKTVGCAVRLADGANFTARTGACVPSTDLPAAIAQVDDLLGDLSRQSGVPLTRDKVALSISSAGLDDEETRRAFTAVLETRCVALHVASDGEAALVGCLGSGDGAAMSVGTGVVAYSRRSGHPDLVFDAWGWPAGDRGGGAYVGREAVEQFLLWVDSGAVESDPLYNALANLIGATRPTILRWLTGAERRDFAAIATTVASAQAAGSDCANAILIDAGAKLRALASILEEQGHSRICLTGGLAQTMRPFIDFSKIEIVPDASLAGAKFFASAWLGQSSRSLLREPS
ncbi:BadF/BadG/BcrA/BcrD ATPase family protein [Mesorhizobium sp. M0047]|uniref:BadF/BadG/BcrA/BcrD ATPase family protein n=1 Tax=Mesorhizobium sp. M0047 TaxID=2956859 RepID=UPI00333C713B